MDNKGLVEKWRAQIVFDSENKMSRKLAKTEVEYIQSLNTFLALENLSDVVNDLGSDELSDYFAKYG